MPIIAHTYYTAGMHELAKVFVESFCYYHVDDAVRLVVHGMGITPEMQADLESRYPFITVFPEPLDSYIEHWADQCGVPVKRLKAWRRQIEHGYVTQESRVWKLLTAGGHRVECVGRMVKSYQRPESDIIIVHFDIDTLFRGSILPLEQEMEGYHVGLKLRPTINPVKARITIDVMALRAFDTTIMWLDMWANFIQETPPMERPIGFGQATAWRAYEYTHQVCDFKDLTLPLKYGLPGRNKPDDVVWCGNVHKLTKDDCVAVFKDELARLKAEGAHD